MEVVTVRKKDPKKVAAGVAGAAARKKNHQVLLDKMRDMKTALLTGEAPAVPAPTAVVVAVPERLSAETPAAGSTRPLSAETPAAGSTRPLSAETPAAGSTRPLSAETPAAGSTRPLSAETPAAGSTRPLSAETPAAGSTRPLSAETPAAGSTRPLIIMGVVGGGAILLLLAALRRTQEARACAVGAALRERQRCN